MQTISPMRLTLIQEVSILVEKIRMEIEYLRAILLKVKPTLILVIERIGVVKYFDTGFVIDIDPNNNNNLDYKNIPNDCEIIGNIYDNPELIKDI